MVEHISNPRLLGAKTLFATHYHELTELEGKLDSVNNYCIAVKEQGDDIIFLRKIIKGGADRSYGIQVAKLAGIPDAVIQRAKEIAEQLTDADITTKAKEIQVDTHPGPVKKNVHPSKNHDSYDGQLSLFDQADNSITIPPVPGKDPVVEKIGELDLGRITPIEALNLLYQLQDDIRKR